MAQHPVEIRWRSIAVSIACFWSLTSIFAYLNKQSENGFLIVEMVKWMGLGPNPYREKSVIRCVIEALLLNSFLFLGEIYQIMIDYYQKYRHETNYKRNPRGIKNFPHYLWARFVYFVFSLWEEKTNWVKLKTLIFAPVLEEFMYRGIIFGLYRDSGVFASHPKLCLTLLPLYFAIAHAHILFKNRNQPDFKQQALIKLFQVFYTQVFGFYSAWIYTHTGSLWSAIVLHSQCNFFGFPNFGVVFDWKTYLPKRIIIGMVYLLGIICFFAIKKLI